MTFYPVKRLVTSLVPATAHTPAGSQFSTISRDPAEPQQPTSGTLPLVQRGQAVQAFAGVPAAVTNRLRGGDAHTVATKCYFDSLTAPDVGAVFVQHPRYAKTFGAHPKHRPQPLVPGTVDPAAFLQGISRDNDERLRSRLDDLRNGACAPYRAQLDALQTRLLATPLLLKHFAEPGAYTRHDVDGRPYWHLVCDTQKIAQGQGGATGQAMDATLFNLEQFVYFSLEPQGCGAAGKSTSRFGARLYRADPHEIAPQLTGASLFTHDFATQPPESRLALFRSADGSTGEPALDERLLARPDGSTAPLLTDDELTEAALAAGEHATRVNGGQRPISRALSVYRYAAEPSDIPPPLALAVTHQTAQVLQQCHTRLDQLRGAGRAQSPAATVLTQLVQRIEHCLARPDDAASQNFLMNHLGIRPQLIVPSSVVLPA